METNPEMNQMMEIASKDFKVVSITMLVMNIKLKDISRKIRRKTIEIL